MTDPVQKRKGLLIGLSIAFSVLTLTTVGFGAATIFLLATNGTADAAPSASPTPTPTATPGHASATIQGFDVSAVSDLSVEQFALAIPSHSETANIYALLTNESESQAADAYFDVTTYREDGRIVERGLDIVYVPPGQTGVLQVELPEDLSGVVSIVIEQTIIDWLAPAVSGGAEVVSVTSTGLSDDFLDVQLTSTLSRPVDGADVHLIGYVDDQIVGVCELWTDIPESGVSFEDLCDWSPAVADEPVPAEALPDGIEFEAYVRFDASALE
ncbi:hypothetical protein [Microbacterium sp. SD291]|uniref:hypothetical protein n=1 Tax=Microbacterium sp. SD291 TaxID=2782007 RepID=UPI001A96C414|nr:hypothetical protein [Microbacterium sp. SD291]MBO0979513.1 hypothetical protein [Microbacterium sp. SD291]